MSNIILRPGDIFCSGNISGKKSFLSSGIRTMEKFWSLDNEATYGHSGIILDASGNTLESLWTIKRQNLFKDYNNGSIIVGRHLSMTPESFNKGYAVVANHEGDFYPSWRLFLFLVMPPLAKYLHFTGMPVCSEYSSKFLHFSDCCGFESYWGLNPDCLADRIRKWKDFYIVFEGVLKV